jgi:ABC-2 type transport system ATP-binding protein
MVQRICIAQALINDPEIVFLDEPMSGLDPLGRMEVRRIIASLKAKGVTVFFSSHVLPDVEALCDRIAILNKGRLQETGSLDDILKVRIEGYEVILSGLHGEALDEIRGNCDEIRSMEDRLRIRVANRERMESLLDFAFRHRLEFISVNPIRLSLEEHFQSIVASRRSSVVSRQ